MPVLGCFSLPNAFAFKVSLSTLSVLSSDTFPSSSSKPQGNIRVGAFATRDYPRDIFRGEYLGSPIEEREAKATMNGAGAAGCS